MSMLTLVLVVPPVSEVNKISWKKAIPVYCFIPSLIQVLVLIYMSFDIPTAVSGGDIIAVGGVGISLLLNIAILTLCAIVSKIAHYFIGRPSL